LLSTEVFEDLNTLSHEVRHNELVTAKDIANTFSLGATHGVTLLLVIISRDAVVAVEQSLIGLDEFLESWLA
jgi:hypothetical protein